MLKTFRTEAGSCVVHDEIFLVTGFTGSKSSLLDDVELLNVSGITANFSPSSRRATLQAFDEDAPTNKPILKVSKQKPANYPHRCTGVACATLTLYKKPNYISQSLAKEVPVDTETNYQSIRLNVSCLLGYSCLFPILLCQNYQI